MKERLDKLEYPHPAVVNQLLDAMMMVNGNEHEDTKAGLVGQHMMQRPSGKCEAWKTDKVQMRTGLKEETASSVHLPKGDKSSPGPCSSNGS